MTNIYIAWVLIFSGIVAGLITGLFFHEEHFLGGYSGWSRRLTRLGHIAFFGLGLINLSFALTARALAMESELAIASWLLILGGVTMPVVCYLAAFRKYFRHLFAIPALSVLVGVALFLWRMLQS
jgi:hypothetical protein